jgi:hypothetical protein
MSLDLRRVLELLRGVVALEKAFLRYMKNLIEIDSLTKHVLIARSRGVTV